MSNFKKSLLKCILGVGIDEWRSYDCEQKRQALEQYNLQRFGKSLEEIDQNVDEIVIPEEDLDDNQDGQEDEQEQPTVEDDELPEGDVVSQPDLGDESEVDLEPEVIQEDEQPK